MTSPARTDRAVAGMPASMSPVAARGGAAPAAVLRRRGQRAAGDGCGGRCGWSTRAGTSLGVAAAARFTPVDARDGDAVPGAAAVHLRLSADGVPALDGPAARCRGWHYVPVGVGLARRPAADAGRLVGAPCAPCMPARWSRSAGWIVGTGAPACGCCGATRGDELACASRALVALSLGLVGLALYRRATCTSRRAAHVRRDQARQLRPAAADLRHGRAPDVPVLRPQCRARPRRLESAAVARLRSGCWSLAHLWLECATAMRGCGCRTARWRRSPRSGCGATGRAARCRRCCASCSSARVAADRLRAVRDAERVVRGRPAASCLAARRRTRCSSASSAACWSRWSRA